MLGCDYLDGAPQKRRMILELIEGRGGEAPAPQLRNDEKEDGTYRIQRMLLLKLLTHHLGIIFISRRRNIKMLLMLKCLGDFALAAAEAEELDLGFVLRVVGEIAGPAVGRFAALHKVGEGAVPCWEGDVERNVGVVGCGCGRGEGDAVG